MKVICWDCRKNVKGELDEETKKIAPHNGSDTYYIICDECKDKGNKCGESRE